MILCWKPGMRWLIFGCSNNWFITITTLRHSNSQAVLQTSNGNIFRVTGLFGGEFTGHWSLASAKHTSSVQDDVEWQLLIFRHPIIIICWYFRVYKSKNMAYNFQLEENYYSSSNHDMLEHDKCCPAKSNVTSSYSLDNINTWKSTSGWLYTFLNTHFNEWRRYTLSLKGSWDRR